MKTSFIHSLILSSLVLASFGCGKSEDATSSRPAGVIDPTNVWSNHTAGFKTCFVNRSAITQADQDFIRTGLWKEYVKTPVSFWGWEQCPSAVEDNVIRITISDERPHYDWKSKNSTFYGTWTVNVAYKKWNSDCSKSEAKRKRCMLIDALHEMGHAAGLNHEQNRSDAVCTKEQDLGNPSHNQAFGEYDPESIMNYCIWQIPGYQPHLTDGDVMGIEKVYNTNLCDGGWDLNIAGQKVYAILTGKGDAVTGTIQVAHVGTFPVAGACVRAAAGVATVVLQTSVPSAAGGLYTQFNGNIINYSQMTGQITDSRHPPLNIPMPVPLVGTKD